LGEASKASIVVMPVGVTSIGGDAFFGFAELESVTLPGLERIRDGWMRGKVPVGAFSKCKALTTVAIPNCTFIGRYAFAECTSLATIGLPRCCTDIGERAFRGCSSLVGVRIPQGCTSVADGVFEGCASLAAVSIPQGCRRIGAWAFWGCKALSTVAIPESCTTIGEWAFLCCQCVPDRLRHPMAQRTRAFVGWPSVNAGV
jgi:hypothetical protein